MADLAPITVEGSAAPPVPPPTAAPDGVQAFTDPGSGLVAVTEKSGAVDFVRKEDAPKVFAEGARPATEGEYYAAKGGTLGTVASFGIGAGRGLSFGLSDPLEVGLAGAFGGEEGAEHMRRALRIAKEAHPGATFGGEVVGSLAPLLLGGGPAAGEGLAGSIERGALGLMGEGAEQSALARAAARFAGAAPSGFGYGALTGIGAQASEDAIQNHPFAASAYVTRGLEGGLIGALLGGALSAGGGAITDKLARYSGRENAQGAKLLEGGPYRSLAEAAEGEPARTPSLGERLQAEAAEQQFKGLHPRQREIQRLGATAEEQSERMQRIGKKLQAEAEEHGLSPFTSTEKWGKHLTERTNEIGADLGRMRARLDQAAERPSMQAIVDRFNAEVAGPAAELPMGEKQIANAANFLEDAVKKGGERPDFQTLYKYRRELDRLLDPKKYAKLPGAALPEGAEALSSLRNIMEDELTTAGERASKELGETFADKYRLTKELYSDLVTAKQIAARAAASGDAHRAISLTDTIAAMAGLATGHPLGSIALGAGNKVLRTYGNQIAATALTKASRLLGVQHAASELDAALDNGARGFLTGKGAGAATQKTMTSGQIRAIRDAVQDPTVVQSRVAAALGNLPRTSPKLAAAVSSAMMRNAAFLRDTLPKEPAPIGPVFGPREPRPLSDSELRSATAKIEAVDNPESVVEHLKSGDLTLEHVEALKVGHPDVYQRMQQYIRDHGAELRPKLTVQQEVALSLLFDQPVNESMLPENVRAFQALFAGANKAEANTPPPSLGNMDNKPRNIGKSGGQRATAWDRIEAGEP